MQRLIGGLERGALLAAARGGNQFAFAGAGAASWVALPNAAR
jgi:hypothetical protein